MPRRATLYVDIDDTIIAQILPGAGLELRPCVITQLTVLSKLYDCCWLTSWPHIEPESPNMSVSRGSIASLMSCLYGNTINETFRYADWDRDHDEGKAEFVLREGAPKDWYWIEDPLFKRETMALEAAGKLDRYISVEPQGPWGFLNAVNKLFSVTAKSASDIRRVGGRPEWFDRFAIAAEQTLRQESESEGEGQRLADDGPEMTVRHRELRPKTST